MKASPSGHCLNVFVEVSSTRSPSAPSIEIGTGVVALNPGHVAIAAASSAGESTSVGSNIGALGSHGFRETSPTVMNMAPQPDPPAAELSAKTPSKSSRTLPGNHSHQPSGTSKLIVVGQWVCDDSLYVPGSMQVSVRPDRAGRHWRVEEAEDRRRGRGVADGAAVGLGVAGGGAAMIPC